MFTKGDKIYADTYKYLRHKTNPVVGLVIKGNESEIEEVDMTLPIQVVVKGNLITWENDKLAFIPHKMEYASIKEQIIKNRYSNDEQLAIILNKDLSEDGLKFYNRMQEWRDFAGELARIVDEEGYQAITALEVAKEKKITEILAYDSSSNVNSFTISGIETWIDKATRVGLKLRFDAEKRLGRTETTLWHNGIQFPLPLEGPITALDMLDGIELYASACYDNTQRHLSNVRALDSVVEIESYDYTIGYPEKLNF
jgi:hypothetical protein